LLLSITDRGIYCAEADVYIDPWKSVPRALITHAHSDHARRGNKQYITQEFSAPIIKHRIKGAKVRGVKFGEKININGVQFSFHPAGHIIGSAQIRVEHKGRIEVASGDYKLESDGISGEIEIIKCHHFITESTFGLPIFRWRPQSEVFSEINDWWTENKNKGKISLLTAYSLGKAQRLIHNLNSEFGTIYTHGTIEKINGLFRDQGIGVPKTSLLTPEISTKQLIGNMVITPSASLGTSWSKNIIAPSIANASGWMALGKNSKRGGADRGFVLSDHADWDGLNKVIELTGASQVTVTHGYTEQFAKHLAEKGTNAYTASTDYTGETMIENESKEES